MTGGRWMALGNALSVARLALTGALDWPNRRAAPLIRIPPLV